MAGARSSERFLQRLAAAMTRPADQSPWQWCHLKMEVHRLPQSDDPARSPQQRGT